MPVVLAHAANVQWPLRHTRQDRKRLMTAILSGSSKWRRAAICAGTAFALLIPGIETPLGPVGSTIPAYADDDGDDDDDDGGARGGRSGSGGGEWRTRQASPPDLLR